MGSETAATAAISQPSYIASWNGVPGPDIRKTAVTPFMLLASLMSTLLIRAWACGLVTR